MGIALYRKNSVHMVRCEKCHRPTHQVYQMHVGDFAYSFCSGMCANEAAKNYKDKEAKGISPQNAQPIEETEGDSLTYAVD